MSTSYASEAAEASRLASLADIEVGRGNHDAARDLYARAAEVTDRAIALTPPEARKTHRLLEGNAVVLRYKANDLPGARRLAFQVLARTPELEGRLRDIITASWQESEPSDEARYLSPCELHMDGGEVQFGLAPTDEVSKRQSGIQSLLWRAAEWLLKLPHRQRGLPSPEIRKRIQLYQAVPGYGSYRLAFRVSAPAKQENLFDAEEFNLVGGDSLVYKTVELVDRVSSASADELGRFVEDPTYRVSFLQIMRDLAPDGSRVAQVSFGGGRAVWKSATIPQEARTEAAQRIGEVVKRERWATITGTLVGIKLAGKDLVMTIKHGNSRTDCHAASDEGFEERVFPLFGHVVQASGRQETARTNKMSLVAIDLAGPFGTGNG
jgi:hypothetical protein